MSNNDQWSVKKFADRRRLRRQQAAATGDLSILAQSEPHFHVAYNTLPDLNQGYETITLACKKMRLVSDSYPEDKVQYYDDPEVGPMIQIMEAKIRDRTGVHAVMMQPVQCFQPCQNIIRVHSVN